MYTSTTTCTSITASSSSTRYITHVRNGRARLVLRVGFGDGGAGEAAHFAGLCLSDIKGESNV
jgi:hypothetical protein